MGGTSPASCQFSSWCLLHTYVSSHHNTRLPFSPNTTTPALCLPTCAALTCACCAFLPHPHLNCLRVGKGTGMAFKALRTGDWHAQRRFSCSNIPFSGATEGKYKRCCRLSTSVLCDIACPLLHPCGVAFPALCHSFCADFHHCAFCAGRMHFLPAVSSFQVLLHYLHALIFHHLPQHAFGSVANTMPTYQFSYYLVLIPGRTGWNKTVWLGRLFALLPCCSILYTL